jgi:3-hydroxybutyryl-CoA dehydrogenase
MTVQGIDKICVVGAGLMGYQIALVSALAGYTATCTDIVPESLIKAEEFVDSYLPGRVEKGKLTADEAKAARARISFTNNLEQAAGDADFVIEAIVEKLQPKRTLFQKLDSICPKHTTLATNSSFIVSSKIVDVTKRPDKVVNMHFFNPALVMKLVEVVKGPHVSDDTAALTMSLCESLGKTPVLLKKEIRGFLVNRILAVMLRESEFLYDAGVASYQDIDTAVVNALGHPMGPFRLMDLTGIDLEYYAAIELFQETGDIRHRPSPILVEKFSKGEFGRKVGKGFYEYPKE